MPDRGNCCKLVPSYTGNVVAELLHFRFAVGSFDSWIQLCKAVEDLRGRGLSPDSFNYLALKHVLAGEVPATVNEWVGGQELAFSEIREAIC